MYLKILFSFKTLKPTILNPLDLNCTRGAKESKSEVKEPR